jgi:cell division protein FtsB
MWIEFLAIFGFGLLLTVLVVLASKNGSKAAQLEALKADIRQRYKEQERAKELANRVDNMDDADIRNRLREISNKR